MQRKFRAPNKLGTKLRMRVAFQLPASLPSPPNFAELYAQCSSGFCNIGSKRPPHDAALVGSAQLHDDEMLFSSEIAASRRPFLVVSQFDWHTNFYSPLLLDTNHLGYSKFLP